MKRGAADGVGCTGVEVEVTTSSDFKLILGRPTIAFALRRDASCEVKSCSARIDEVRDLVCAQSKVEDLKFAHLTIEKRIGKLRLADVILGRIEIRQIRWDLSCCDRLAIHVEDGSVATKGHGNVVPGSNAERVRLKFKFVGVSIGGDRKFKSSARR